MQIQLGLRILKFFNFCFVNKLNCSICWFEGEFHIYASQGGNIYSSGQQPRLSDALDEACQGFRNVGWTE